MPGAEFKMTDFLAAVAALHNRIFKPYRKWVVHVKLLHKQAAKELFKSRNLHDLTDQGSREVNHTDSI